MEWVTVRDRFARHQRASGLSERTIRARDELLVMLERHSGLGPLAVQKDDLLDLLTRPNHRTGAPLAPGTKQVERSYLQTWGRWMVEEGYRAQDPAVRLPRVKVPRRRPRPLQLGHIDDMLTSGVYRRTREIITVAALTGLRIGEVVKIRGEDVDLARGSIRSVRKGGLDQLVYMPDPVREIARSKPDRGWWFPSPYANAQFPNGGGHVLMRSASTRISIVLRRVGITDPKITAHSLRHFYATTLLAEGVQIRVVQEMLGHASLATTQLYTDVPEAAMSDAANVLPMISPRATSSRVSGRIAA